MACGYSAGALEEAMALDLSDSRLNERGAAGQQVSELYTMACSATSNDVR